MRPVLARNLSSCCGHVAVEWSAGVAQAVVLALPSRCLVAAERCWGGSGLAWPKGRSDYATNARPNRPGPQGLSHRVPDSWGEAPRDMVSLMAWWMGRGCGWAVTCTVTGGVSITRGFSPSTTPALQPPRMPAMTPPTAAVRGCTDLARLAARCHTRREDDEARSRRRSLCGRGGL